VSDSRRPVVVSGQEHKPRSAESAVDALRRRQTERQTIADRLQDRPVYQEESNLDRSTGLANAIEQLANWHQRLPQQGEISEPGFDWRTFYVDGEAYERAIRRVIYAGQIDHPVVRAWASARRVLADSAAFRRLRNVPGPALRRLTEGAGKARTQADLWLLLRLPEPPEPGRHINVRVLRRDLKALLAQEDWSSPAWCLTESEAIHLAAQLRRRLHASPQDFRSWLVKIGWHSPMRRRPHKITTKSVKTPQGL
jgi:hypothetical protein